MNITTFLIIGGVVLLVIAIVLLIVQKIKTKKDNANATVQPAADPNAVNPQMNGQMPVVDPNAMGMAMPQEPNMMNQGMQPITDPNAIVPEQPMPLPVAQDPNMGAQLPGVQVPAEQVAPTPITPPAPENSVNNMPEVTVLPVDAAPIDASGDVTTPSFEAQSPMGPTPAPMPAVEPAPIEPAPAPMPAPVAPAPVMPAPTPAPTVYGGENPSVPQINVNNEEPRQIYGGADPLENTQPIPQAPVVPEVTPTPAPVAPAPTPAPAPAAPVVPNIAPATPVPAPTPAAPAQTPGVPPIQTS